MLQRIPIACFLSAPVFAVGTGCCLLLILKPPALVPECLKPTGHKGPMRAGTSSKCLVPCSLSFSTTGSQEGQGTGFTHSLNTESSYSELSAPQKKIPKHLQGKYMANSRKLLLKYYVQIGSKIKNFPPLSPSPQKIRM